MTSPKYDKIKAKIAVKHPIFAKYKSEANSASCVRTSSDTKKKIATKARSWMNVCFVINSMARRRTRAGDSLI